MNQNNCESAFGASATVSSVANLFDSPILSVAWLKDGVDFPHKQVKNETTKWRCLFSAERN